MKIFNFISSTEKYSQKSMRSWYLISFSLFISVTCFISFMQIKQLWNYFDIKNHHDILWQYVNEQKLFIEKNKKLDKKLEFLGKKFKLINTKNSLPTKKLINISQIIPNNSKLLKIRILNNKYIYLIGLSKTISSLTNFVKYLSMSTEFNNAKLLKTKKTNDNIYYVIKINLK